ncbi:AAA family ATPase [Deinococcus taklimakanensis]|uniref:AAA family ATPase n=1 Tax=Deinococcus taklimakanensis TaxID=536443 RepID=A0ABW5P1R5_9DEIO
MSAVHDPELPTHFHPQNRAEPREAEIDLELLWDGVRRRLPWVLLGVALTVPAVYSWEKSRPNVFESSATLMTSGSLGVPGVGDSLVKASPLPEGALREALRGPVVMGEIIDRVKRDSRFPEGLKGELASDLEVQRRMKRLGTFQLVASIDPLSQQGLYTVMARSSDAQTSEILVNIAADALLNWDKGRALRSLDRAARSFQAQLTEIDRQLANAALPRVERETLVASRANVQRNLAQAKLQAEGVSGSLDLVSPGLAPQTPLAPRPLRSAGLAGLLALALGLVLAVLLTLLDRRVQTEDDLLSLGLPTLGLLPRLKRREVARRGLIGAAATSEMYEGAGFLRVNLLSRLSSRPGQRVMVTSTAPGEGKSTLAAILANALAEAGKRVLLIDADPHRSSQAQIWSQGAPEQSWLQLRGEGGVRQFHEALRSPGAVQVLEVRPNLHFLPAGGESAQIQPEELRAFLEASAQAYDLIILDTPPLLSVSDTLVMGRMMDAVLLVTEEGKTSIKAVEQTLRRAREVGLPVLGFVLNKMARASREGYGYASAYRGRPVQS